MTSYCTLFVEYNSSEVLSHTTTPTNVITPLTVMNTSVLHLRKLSVSWLRLLEVVDTVLVEFEEKVYKH